MFEKYEPQAGDQILSAHIRNLEDYISPLITIDNGSQVTGVTKLIIGQNLLATGTASGGVTLYTTGIAGFTTSLSGSTDVEVSGSTTGDLLIKKANGKWGYVSSGSVGGSNSSSTIGIPALYSNFYTGLYQEMMVTSNYQMSGVYIKTTNAPSATITFDIYKNGSTILTGATMTTGGVCDASVSSSLVKGDVIKFYTSTVNDITAGNPIFFGIY